MAFCYRMTRLSLFTRRQRILCCERRLNETQLMTVRQPTCLISGAHCETWWARTSLWCGRPRQARRSRPSRQVHACGHLADRSTRNGQGEIGLILGMSDLLHAVYLLWIGVTM